MPRPTRREILAGSLVTFGATLGLASGLDRVWAALPDVSPLEPLRRGKLLGLVPFTPPAAKVPQALVFGTLDGEGISARRLLDLSTLSDATRITPTDQHFIRTRPPAELPAPGSWRVAVRTTMSSPQELTLADLRQLAEPMGVHLCESAANDAAVGFGMISAAEWSGVPVAKLLEKFGQPETPFRVVVDGHDLHRTSIPDLRIGASWIFSPAELRESGAFLALSVNGGELPVEQGAPVRLVVPGWYGCTWIKWVHTVAVVPDDIFASPHMKEFAARTHQAGVPRRAYRFAPAVVDAAALPIRVEKWRVRGAIEHRIVGVRWGSGKVSEGVSIRFAPDQPWEPVTTVAPAAADHTWSFWSHRWLPAAPGTYTLELAVGQSRIRTRRLSNGHYNRRVTI